VNLHPSAPLRQKKEKEKEKEKKKKDKIWQPSDY
jgi:hypothetical protein